MDLNRKYAAHQTAVFQASLALDAVQRAVHMDEAKEIALRIGRNRLRLGAALACAWSMSQDSLHPVTDLLIR